MNTWIARQFEHKIAQFDGAIRTHYPNEARFFEDPREFYRGLRDLWNYWEAVKKIDWGAVLPPGAVCLDLGAGVGWLSAYLSTFPNVAKVHAADSCRSFLRNMLPGLQDLMGARPEKIEPVESFFSPLYFDSKSFDAVLASSALHHAESLEEVLGEIRRVLKDDGTLYILNELPHGAVGYLGMLLKSFMAIFVRSLFRVYKPVSRALSSSGVLDDPYLGDRRYPLWYWLQAIHRAGFVVHRVQRTGLVTLKSKKRGMMLTHFICKKRAETSPSGSEAR